jgi:hypothetical protein
VDLYPLKNYHLDDTWIYSHLITGSDLDKTAVMKGLCYMIRYVLLTCSGYCEGNR